MTNVHKLKESGSKISDNSNQTTFSLQSNQLLFGLLGFNFNLVRFHYFSETQPSNKHTIERQQKIEREMYNYSNNTTA